ncbi:MAG: hypothetical protein ACLQIQ_06660 [Beijerinckiaceae bacterium]
MARFQYFRIAAITVVLIAGSTALAQSQAEDHGQDTPKETAPEKPSARPAKPYGGGTPLDVIINNRLWTEAPEPKDFVRQNRQSVDELKYRPTAGTDPERPKNRTKDELKALQSELEEAASHNSRAASGKKVSGKKTASPTPAAQKTKTTGASDKTHSADKTN